ncbi:MAG: hypothetical protein WDZ41_02475 [Candidatus Babeliales bacterium]
MKKFLSILLLIFSLCSLMAIDERGVKEIISKANTDTAHIFYNDDPTNAVILKFAQEIDSPIKTVKIMPGEHKIVSQQEAMRYPKIGIDLEGITTRSWWIKLDPLSDTGSLYVIEGNPENSSGMEYKMHYWDKRSGAGPIKYYY